MDLKAKIAACEKLLASPFAGERAAAAGRIAVLRAQLGQEHARRAAAARKFLHWFIVDPATPAFVAKMDDREAIEQAEWEAGRDRFDTWIAYGQRTPDDPRAAWPKPV